MKVAKLINMLEKHNLNADIIFQTTQRNKNNAIIISSKASCKCQEKEIYLAIGFKKEDANV